MEATAVAVMVEEITAEVVTVAGEAGGVERVEVEAALARAAAASCGSDGRVEPCGGWLGDASVILPSENHRVEAYGGWWDGALAVLEEHGCLAWFCSFLPALLAWFIAKAL